MKLEKQAGSRPPPGTGRDQNGHGRSDGKAGGRRQCGLNRTRTKSFVDSEFVAGMCAQCIVCHQLLCNFFRERNIQPASDVNSHQFLVLALIVLTLAPRAPDPVPPFLCRLASGLKRTRRLP